ncbi:hypothetical protein [Phytohabitans aurantiacus]|uniref:Uncharacterized protein n=1 Tax=Phytohabitans aurantiacus TaxID=3016789 RepID=A0ABQ5QMT8_9ACTN|nr:hypothetical protein [Phytohabitans aurantiacus]GLH95554.1 hypothetical protein Pa4123_08260 [Phytohabitans aurantiacus]
MQQPDNLQPGPARPLGVTPDDLERALRESLASASADVAPVRHADPAGTAIRRAKRINRRRSIAGTALVAVATVAAAMGVVQLRPAPERNAGPVWVGDPYPSILRSGDPTPTQLDPPDGSDDLRRQDLAVGDVMPVDVVLNTHLQTASGKVVDLAALGTVTQAHRADSGWLIVAAQETGRSALWWVNPDGSARELLPPVEAVVLASDGLRVAWLDGARLFSASVIRGQVSGAQQSAALTQGQPVSFLGRAVLMARTRDGGDDEYAVWWPDGGEAFKPTWNGTTVGIYGPLPDGHTVVGQVTQGQNNRACLALLDARNALTVLKTACATRLKRDGSGSVSPDGRWLVADAETANLAALVDLSGAFKQRTATATRYAGPLLTGRPVWTDANTVVRADHDGLVRVEADELAVDQAKGVEHLAVPSMKAGDRVVVASKQLV